MKYNYDKAEDFEKERKGEKKKKKKVVNSDPNSCHIKYELFYLFYKKKKKKKEKMNCFAINVFKIK